MSSSVEVEKMKIEHPEGEGTHMVDQEKILKLRAVARTEELVVMTLSSC